MGKEAFIKKTNIRLSLYHAHESIKRIERTKIDPQPQSAKKPSLFSVLPDIQSVSGTHFQSAHNSPIFDLIYLAYHMGCSKPTSPIKQSQENDKRNTLLTPHSIEETSCGWAAH
jgi:hypothetical protein